MNSTSPIRVARTSVLIAAVALFVVPLSRAWSQEPTAQEPTGRITGRIVDARSGAALTDVGVQVVGAQPGTTSSGTMSGVDGRYSLPRVRAGTVTLHMRRLGYQAKTITGVLVPANGAVEQHVTLDPATVQLSATIVTADAERGTVNAALDQQRNATGIVNAVTSEQIQRSPDSDAAQAVQRVSGVTVQDGRYVFVRGLGERYTTTSLNGARMPSPEPERKVVPLDLFPAGLLQTITTSKTFTPDQPGDFSGAAVDIRTREFPAIRQVTYSMSTGVNTAASGRNVFFAQGVGGEQFALAGRRRFLPELARAAGDLSGTTQREENEIINSFRDVWRANSRTGRANSSFSASVGGNDPVFGHRIGYLASGTYAYSQEARVDDTRAMVRPASTAGAGTEEFNRFNGTAGRTSVLWGGILNLSTLLGSHSRLSLNNTYNRTADNEARVERGLLEEFSLPIEVQRLDYVERSVWSSQLAGEHTLSRHSISWAATASRVTRDQPDRSELVYEVAPTAGGGERLLWFNTHSEAAVRTFAALDEEAYEGSANYRFEFGPAARQFVLKVGGLGRIVDRAADTRSFQITAPILSEDRRALPPEELFGGRFSAPDSTVFRLGPLAAGGSYTASDELGAGYAMLDAGLTARLRLIGGARLERSQVRVNAVSSLGDPSTSDRTYTDVLPSVAVNYRPGETQNLRLSVSRTLARPEYRELARVRGRDAIGGIDIVGNPNLIRTLISNADIRWEWYPTAGEVLSVGVFAKHFDNPIERVIRSAGNALVDFVNADAAENYGVELEARKGLGFLTDRLNALTAFTNVTVMRSEIRLGDSEAGRLNTRGDRPMVGQAPYVVNVGLGYSSPSGRTSATVLYNRVGERILYAGASGLPDAEEKPRDVLDASLRFPVLRGVSGRFDAKNLLDSDYVIAQGDVKRDAYRAGRTFTLGLTFRR